MKYLKTFKEAVIHPPKREENDFTINSFEDLVEYGNQYNFDAVNYEDFYSSLSEADKRNAPPKAVPFFALFHPENKKPMFVLPDERTIQRVDDFKEIVDDIIGHELIHAEQSRRKGDIEYSLPSPTKQKEYFSNKEEIMAFSWTIANELLKISDSVQDAMSRLDSNVMPPTFDRFSAKWYRMWNDIKRVCDDDVIKRYRKYIYLYLRDMLSNEEENIHTRISKKSS